MWDLVVVGAGPAGTAAALGALAARPELEVLMLDRSDFPRDKACGDGIAPHVLDVLDDVGVHGLIDDWSPIADLELRHGSSRARRTMARPAKVVPRSVFDARLVAAAVAAGARLERHRVRSVDVGTNSVVLDGAIEAKVVVGADGAYSQIRVATGLVAARRAFAIRGYVATPEERTGLQLITFGRTRQPSYAWSFDRGDGLSNVGYGELLGPGRPAPSRAVLFEQLHSLLPGAIESGSDWRGHHLPLSSWRWDHPDGRVLLVGDAAGLINPMTGEGIYYAVATGVQAGRAAAAALEVGAEHTAGSLYRRGVRSLLGSHLRHTAGIAHMLTLPALAPAGIRAAQHQQSVFDDLVEVGLGRGRVRLRTVVGVGRAVGRPGPPGS